MKKYILNIISIFLVLTLTIVGTTFAKTGSIQNSDYLNLREKPSTSSNLLVKMPGDASFEILAEEGDWYKIQYKDYIGYVSKQYVKIEETNTNIPARANSDGIINSKVDVYVLPLLNSSKIGNLSVGDEVLVVSIAGKWAFVQTNTISGWIYYNAVNATEESNSNSESSENNIENKTDQSEIDDINENNQDNKVDENNKENADNSENTTTSDVDYPKTMYVNVDAVYIRQTPSTDSNAVASVGLNTPVTVNGEDGDWYKVYVTDGSGYMMKKYLSETKQ